MIIINNNEVVVFTYLELKSALEENNGYNIIHFGDNITLTNGININSSKTNVIIDGSYDGVTYTLTDKKSTAASDTIRVSSAFNKSVTIRNIIIEGYNYYGVVYVPDSSTYKDTTIILENINYIGPQIIFNPYGLTRFLNAFVIIQDNYAVGNEVCECNRIEIGGSTTIEHRSKSNSSFWFRNSNPYFHILENSTVNFTSLYRELIYGVTDLDFVVGKNSYFSVTSNSGMGYGTNGTNNTSILENATFILKQTNSNGSYATWYSYGVITVSANATLEIINDYTNINSNNYNIYFARSTAGLIINNPKKVMLYNKVANIIYTSSSIPFNFTFNRINLINTAYSITDNITPLTLPTYSWYKNNQLSNVVGTFTNSGSVVTSNNFSDEELVNLPELSNFVFHNKRVLSIGDFPLLVDAVTDKDTKITGHTLSNASILISYNDVSSVVPSDDDGNFIYNYQTQVGLDIGTVITINAKEKDELIYHTKKITIVYEGEIIIDEHTSLITFLLSPINLNPLICPKSDIINIEVIDSRINSTDWELYARLDGDFVTVDKDILESIVFLNSNGEYVTLTGDDILVYSGVANDGVTKSTLIEWGKNDGILLKVTNPVKINKTYTTKIIWTLKV